MRILLSTIGSRGDVQPLVAFAFALKARGQEVRLCVPPDFCDWIKGLGLTATPLGPELRWTARPSSAAGMPTPEQRRQMMDATVATQFETLMAASEGCDLIVGATALQIAAPSVAEKRKVPYVFATFCPGVLPSSHHAPPTYPLRAEPAPTSPDEIKALWAGDGQRFNTLFGAALNAQRASLGLAPIDDVRAHVFTPRPWLAADPTLAPWPTPLDDAVVQTGAWILADERPLDDALEAFLEAGEPPVYFGFGSVRASGDDLGEVMIASARARGRRAIISRGWAELKLADDAPDCLSIDEVNQQALFQRVAAVVHHGGAGTTTIAALAGAPQVIIPQLYDQAYWAKRIAHLGIGSAHAPGAPSAASLTNALERALEPSVALRARVLAGSIRRDGAMRAADLLLSTR